MTGSVLWLDGQLVAADDARVSPFDHGLLVGDGVFETLRVYEGVPFAWTRHHRRLVRSAAGLGLTAPSSRELRAAVDDVLDANGVTEGRVRLTVTGGPSPLGSERGDAPPTVIVMSAPATPWPPTVDVVIVPWSRNETITTSTVGGHGVVIVPWSRNERGAVAGLKTDAGCLLGVTRALVLELCAEHDMPAEEAVLGPAALDDADEAFLTSSTREVQPIGRVDGRALPAAPGPTSEKLGALLTELIGRVPDP